MGLNRSRGGLLIPSALNSAMPVRPDVVAARAVAEDGEEGVVLQFAVDGRKTARGARLDEMPYDKQPTP